MKIPLVSANLIERSSPFGSYGRVCSCFSSRRLRSTSARVAGSCAKATSVKRHNRASASTPLLNMAAVSPVLEPYVGRILRIGSASRRGALDHRSIERFDLSSQAAIPRPHPTFVRFLQRAGSIPTIARDAVDGDERARAISSSFAMNEDRTWRRAKNLEETFHGVGRDLTGPVEDVAVLDRDVYETHPERLDDPPFAFDRSVTVVADVEDCTNA